MIRHRPGRYCAIAVAMLATQLAACHHWVPADTVPRTYFVEHRPEQVRLSVADSTTGALSVVELRRPLLEGDTLRGLDVAYGERTLLVGDVTHVEERRLHTLKTVGAVVGVTYLLVGIVALMTVDWDDTWSYGGSWGGSGSSGPFGCITC